jgi:cell division protein FtsB
MSDLAPILQALALVITAIVSGLSLWLNFKSKALQTQQAATIQKLEVNTNSLSERNQAIAKKLGVEEGKAAEKQNPSGGSP